MPVGDGTAAVEESGPGEDEGAGAEGGDRGAGAVGAAQGVEDGLGDGRLVVDQPRHDDEVGLLQPVEGAVRGEGEAARHEDGVAGGGGGAAQFEGRDAGRVRSLPQTSVMTETSKARMPGNARRAMRCMAP